MQISDPQLLGENKCLCLHAQVYAGECMCVCADTCGHEYESQRTIVYTGPQTPSPAGWPQNPSLSASPALGLHAHTTTPSFSPWVLRTEVKSLCLPDKNFTNEAVFPAQIWGGGLVLFCFVRIIFGGNVLCSNR